MKRSWVESSFLSEFTGTNDQRWQGLRPHAGRRELFLAPTLRIFAHLSHKEICALCRFFAIEPNVKVIFGFKVSQPDEELAKTRLFLRHSSYFIKIIDKALGLLGPDVELLTEILLELGQKHVNYGVKPAYFAVLGQALIATIQETLGDEFTQEIKVSWVEVYNALSYDMIRAQKM